MRLLSWNFQGLGSTLTIRALRETQIKTGEECVFLMETKNSLLNYWHCSFIYGEPKKSTRRIFLQKWKTLADLIRGPWVCLGDLNFILHSSKKEGGRVLNECGLKEIPSEEPFFTWSNKRDESYLIRAKLDRVVCNE
uniref:Uncharacterized protein n=1 Tax=Nelumbo nucifera TaxID=4432 RepID=A0A822ZFK9_NELNU|nr:TPA_asm: hypothetical protein HUJ06_000761 [Nelumbo nucifera]